MYREKEEVFESFPLELFANLTFVLTLLSTGR